MGTRRDPFIGNPFLDSFWKSAIRFLNVKEKQTCGDAVISLMTKPPLRCDDYFNKNFRDKVPAPAPLLMVNKELWMSLTAMEVQASELSIRRANGVVWTAGLGLGYFPLRCALKEDVTEVNVVEISPNVIELFNRMHRRKRGFKKIKVHCGDARKIIKGKEADYCWMDTYRSLHSDTVISDGRFYQKHNQFKEYCFWGWELVMLWCLQFKILRPLYIPRYVLDYLHIWMRTPMFQGKEKDLDEYHKDMTLANLAKEPLDQKFCKAALRSSIHIKYT